MSDENNYKLGRLAVDLLVSSYTVPSLQGAHNQCVCFSELTNRSLLNSNAFLETEILNMALSGIGGNSPRLLFLTTLGSISKERSCRDISDGIVIKWRVCCPASGKRAGHPCCFRCQWDTNTGDHQIERAHSIAIEAFPILQCV